MAKIELTKISPGDSLSATALNSDIDQWNLRTQSIDGENVREEGVDRRNLASYSVSSPSSTGISSSYAQFTSQVTIQSSTPKAIAGSEIGPFTYDSSTDVGLKINVSFQFKTPELQNANSTDPHYTTVRPGWNFQLYYKNGGGGTYTAVTGTKRELSIDCEGMSRVDSFSIAHMFTMASSTALYFKVYAWEDMSGTPLEIGVLNFNAFGTRYLR
jgi:hypothetical protein